MQLYCPQCDCALETGATKCPKCPATFTDPNGWQPITAESLRGSKKLAWTSVLILLSIFYFLPILGLSLAYRFGYPGVGFGFGVYLMFAIPAGVIAAIASQIASSISKRR